MDGKSSAASRSNSVLVRALPLAENLANKRARAAGELRAVIEKVSSVLLRAQRHTSRALLLPDGALPDGALPDGALPDGALPGGSTWVASDIQRTEPQKKRDHE